MGLKLPTFFPTGKLFFWLVISKCHMYSALSLLLSKEMRKPKGFISPEDSHSWQKTNLCFPRLQEHKSSYPLSLTCFIAVRHSVYLYTEHCRTSVSILIKHKYLPDPRSHEILDTLKHVV